MGSEIRQLKKDIAASLFIKPCSFEKLIEMDFLKNRSEWGVDVLLRQMIKDRWVYVQNDTYHTYKKFAKSKEMLEYDLDV